MVTKTKIINFVGGPGVGKSTTALGVAYNLKKRLRNIEYVAEYAKDVTWEGTHALLENQIHIFSEQFRRQFRLIDHVELVVTDSPLILSCVYHDYALHKLPAPDYIQAAKLFMLETYRQFDNMTYLIKGGIRPYNPVGRNQTKEEAEKVHKATIVFMEWHGIPYQEIEPADPGIAHVLRDLGIEPDDAQQRLDEALALIAKFEKFHSAMPYDINEVLGIERNEDS